MINNFLEFLEATTARLPDKVAFTDEYQSLTFSQFYDITRSIGTHLGKKTGVIKQPVAILMDAFRITYIQAMIGINYAGCFFAPLDPNAPMERLNLLLERLNPCAVIYDEKNEKTAKVLSEKYTIVSFEEALKEEIDTDLLNNIRSRCSYYDLMFVMFTSGSTGIPKWVTHTHHDMEMYSYSIEEMFGYTENDVEGNQSPLFYANCFGSIFLQLAFGASTCILSGSALSFPKKMIRALKEYKVTSLTMTPSSFTAVADSGALEGEIIPDLKFITFSGEACNSSAVRKWLAVCPNAHLMSFYGSTEGIDVATKWYDEPPKPGEIVTCGRLYTGVHMLIVDENDEEVPYGEKGEMLVHTPTMSEGYYNDPERTKEAFVDDPLHRGYHELFYRTGDLGYFNEDGELVVTGRKDNMIKHKGYRMELGEVEAAAKNLDGCKDCCCVHIKDKDELCCFFTGTITEENLRKTLRTILPKFALPEHFRHLETIPYTATVKADRKALLQMLHEG